MSAKKEIMDTILKMSGAHSPYNIFTDWIEMCALSIQNSCCQVHNKIWKDREQLYIDTARRYNESELSEFARMFVLLGDALTDSMSDVLGEIYMESGMGSKYTGQFFTPFHLSELCARMNLTETIENYNGEVITLNEPSCGGGGMIIAAVKVLLDAGINPQECLRVVAQDLDWKGVYMCYLQLSLLGIRAVVVQGNTLSDPYRHGYPPERTLITPAEMTGGAWRYVAEEKQHG